MAYAAADTAAADGVVRSRLLDSGSMHMHMHLWHPTPHTPHPTPHTPHPISHIPHPTSLHPTPHTHPQHLAAIGESFDASLPVEPPLSPPALPADEDSPKLRGRKNSANI